MKKTFNKLMVVLTIIVMFNFLVMRLSNATETSPTEPVENKTVETKPVEEKKEENTTPTENTTKNSENKTKSSDSTTNKTKTETQKIDKSNDCDLKSLTIGEGTLSPVFSKDVVSYKVKFPNNYDFSSLKEIKIEAQANDSKASVTGTGVRSVKGEGITNLAVTVKAENGKEKTYTITIEKPKELSISDLKLSSLNIDKKNSKGILSSLEFTPTFNENTLEYTADVDEDVESVVIYAKAASGIEVEIEGATTDGNYDLSGGKNTIYITLTSENDSSLVTNYKLTINKPEDENGLEESEEKKEQKNINKKAIIIAIIVVLAVLLFTLMIINYKQKKANGDYDDDTEEEKDVKIKKKTQKSLDKKNSKEGKRFSK